MLKRPFLTDLDSRAAIKGSRDPLGVQAIWTHFGRKVVGNLTTVSTSLRDFTVLLLGYYFTERASDAGYSDSDLSLFLRWEQLAAYARGSVNDDWGFRGVDRVRRNIGNDTKVYLATDPSWLILSDQKTYGLWGLYTSPARTSALVEGDPSRLTPPARELVESVYLPVFAKAGMKNGDAIVKLLCQKRGRVDIEARDREMLNAIAKVLTPKLQRDEYDLYRNHLVHGGPGEQTHGLQPILAALLEETFADDNWYLSPTTALSLARKARKHGSRGAALADHLERIRTCELLLAPTVALFDMLLNSTQQTVADIAASLRQNWGASVTTIDHDATRALESEIRSATSSETASSWMRLSHCLSTGDYETAITALIEHNTFIMKTRAAAAPWIEIRENKLHVRIRDLRGVTLPARNELDDYSLHPYFVDSLRTVAKSLRA